MQLKIDLFKQLLLTSKTHIEKCRNFSQFENNYVGKDYDDFLIEVKYTLQNNTKTRSESTGDGSISPTLFNITKNLLNDSTDLFERFKYKEDLDGLINDYEITADFNYVLKFNSTANKFELNNKYKPNFGIRMVNSTPLLLKGFVGASRSEQIFGKLQSKEHFEPIKKQISNLKTMFETSNKQIKKDLKPLLSLILDSKVKKYNELAKIPELELDKNIDNKILSYEGKQDLCKPLIQKWINKNISESVRKYFYPNFVISLYHDNWISFDFDANEFVVM